MVLLSDQPEIDPMVIDRLIEVRRTGRAPLAMATYGKDRGHPVLFGSELFPELRSITGDQGGRDVVQRHRSDLVLVPAGKALFPWMSTPRWITGRCCIASTRGKHPSSSRMGPGNEEPAGGVSH